MRHIKRNMRQRYGLHFTGLVHPLINEFNHKAVIHQRVSRLYHEVIGDTKSLWLNNLNYKYVFF